jgi:hypothetical protein
LLDYEDRPDGTELAMAVWIGLLFGADMSQATPEVRDLYNRNQQFVTDEAGRQFFSDPLLRELVEQTLFVMFAFHASTGGHPENIQRSRFFSAKVKPLDARGYKKLVEACAAKFCVLAGG